MKLIKKQKLIIWKQNQKKSEDKLIKQIKEKDLIIERLIEENNALKKELLEKILLLRKTSIISKIKFHKFFIELNIIIK